MAALKKSKHCHTAQETFIFVLLLRAQGKLSEGGLGARHEEETARSEDCLHVDYAVSKGTDFLAKQ